MTGRRFGRGVLLGFGMVSAAAAAARATAPAQPAVLVRASVVAKLDPAASMLEATARLTVVPGLEGREPVHFLLLKDLALVRVSGRGTAVAFEEGRAFDPNHFWDEPDYESLTDYRMAREVSVTPRAAWPDTIDLVFEYHGAVYDSLRSPEVAYARSFEQSLGLIDPRGVYLEGASFWLPTLPGQLYAFDLSVELPSGWRSVSQGRLDMHDEADGLARDRWICAAPMEEIYLIAGPLVAREVDHEGRALYTFTHAADDSLTARYLDATARYLDLYESLYGPYPFEKFALVENFWQTGYGMPSFTLLGDQVIRLPFIIDTSYAHEILHNWWGNGVFVDAESGNWCEGLTAFGSDYRAAEGRGEGRDYRLGVLRDYLNYVREGRDLPLTAFRERENAWTQAVGYGKSTMIFHMLRRSLGTEAFDAGLRAFYRENLFRFAGWRELVDALSKMSGVDLSGVREQWIERAGAPALRPGPVSFERTRTGFRLEGAIAQSVPPYRLDVPVRVETAAGDTTFDVPVTGETGSFSVDLAMPPRSVWIDPEFDLFRRLDRAEIPPTLSQTLGAESTLVVIDAAGELGEAYEALAREWSGRGGFEVTRSSSIVDWDAPGRSVWVLGAGPPGGGLGALAPAGAWLGPGRWLFDGTQVNGKSVVVTLRHPNDPEQSISWLEAFDPEVIASIGRKIPHYGKYSYLVFDGTRNVAKGVWKLTESPMRVSLEAQ